MMNITKQLKRKYNSYFRKIIINMKISDLLIFCCIFLAWFFNMFTLLFVAHTETAYGNNVFLLQSNVYFFSAKTTQIIFSFNPFTITSTIFISFAIIIALYVWLNSFLQSIYLIKLFGIKVIFDNPFLNQFIIYFVIFYAVIWATICPNPYDLSTHFSLYSFNMETAQITPGAIVFIIFYMITSFYIMFISLNKSNEIQKHWILNEVLSVKRVIIFGITGSVGLQTLEVIKKLDTKINLVGCSFGNNVSKMNEIMNEFQNIKHIYSPFESSLNNVKDYEDLILQTKPDLIVNAVSGINGINISFLAIKHKKDLALANKESLVAAGKLLIKQAKDAGINIFPIDSEHASLKAIIDSYKIENIKDLLITCSGGPFYDLDETELQRVSYQEAIKHPTWKMGEKISVDSATLMNKVFELIEAYWLFDTKKIRPILHKQSYVHAMCELNNNSVIMFTSVPNMQLPIELALQNFQVSDAIIQEVNFTKLNLEFDEINYSKWIGFELARLYFNEYVNTNFGAIITALDEIAIRKFKNQELNFSQIVPFITENYNKFNIKELNNLEDVQKTIEEVNESFKM